MPSRQDDSGAERVLVRMPNWIGDAVFAIPALRALAKRRPDAEVTLLGPASVCRLLEGEDFVHGVIALEAAEVRSVRRRLRIARGLRRRHSLAVVLPDSFASALEVWVARVPRRIGRPSQGRGPLLTDRVPYGAPPRTRHLAEEFLELVGEKGGFDRDAQPLLSPAAGATGRAEVLLPSAGEALRIGLVPGAAFGPAKRWPRDRFVELARSFEDAEIVVFGSDEERPLGEFIASRIQNRTVILAGRTTTPLLAACLARCDLVIGNDTGPTHIAAALGTPVIALYGSTNPVWTGPMGPTHGVVRTPLACAPCYLRRCDRGYVCFEGITVEDVRRAVHDLLRDQPFDRTAGCAQAK